MPRAHASDGVDEKRLERRKYQTFLHHEKKSYIQQMAELLLPPDMINQDTRIVLRAIREILEKKFPEKIGKENGCLFRRTVEFDGVRKSIWAPCDPSKNAQLFEAKNGGVKNYRVKVEVKEEPDSGDNISLQKVNPMIKTELNPEEPNVDHINPLMQVAPPPVQQVYHFPFHYNPGVLHFFNSMLHPPPNPTLMFDAVYPEQRDVFGNISFHQKLEYDRVNAELAALMPQPSRNMGNMFHPQFGTVSPNRFMHWQPVPYYPPPSNLNGINLLVQPNFHFEEEHNWTLMASPPGPPLTEDEAAGFEFPDLKL
ncbi:Protein CBG24764 [Caenorhabditis briggsae]|uniref:Protein CBG08604 n=1 Tax=Caenorhabditis briggsae TaxID=6238 RepID=G2J685_CAEBR|nr:Protein CBG08604 [Caenorhabditis briggsae]XP_002648474.1 Protein CBG24764 [Caenorhabditis briggsae]CAP21298.1 Protein CBG24764 [Caenorhabditis briggsae]CAP28418.1 Protein CBG08604 [Caenorhabditis briggsae]